ncbi:integrator complex subunit 6 [Anopheles nili]|uniref:integrator complex subunit 6 n=1 Tax=Anopheles nili TaxID=185578 RepID=UPI00237B58B8|nr:integrator complex subunit 6 [Anopheles nili]
MTIIVFLVDTSASMCQRSLVNGVQKTYLDIAKGAVETFLKFRQRSQDCMGDRYMLLTFEDPPNNVKAGWKENHATFMNELKNLQSNGLTSMGEALKNAFDLLNLNRMQSGIDTYGQGRCPFYLEPSVIIVLTDGGKYAFRNGVHQEIILPLHAQMPGTKLTKEPFRWDQRLFSLVLRMPGNRVEERADGKVPCDDSMIEKMCEVTGGRSYKIKSHYVLNQCIESLVQKVQPGVVIHFDQLITNNGDSSTADIQFQATKRMIYVPKQHPSQKTFPVGYWPIPEPYWPDPKLTNLPPRDAHPKIKVISPCCDEPQVLRNFPIDKYELEASPLTLQLLSKKESNKVWPLIVSTGMQGEMPFGYLKPNSTLPIVHLYVLPYNYQMLLPLINDLFHKFNLNPPNDWVYKFTNYVKTIPQYYCPFLRRALATMPNVPYQLVQYILPENLDSYLCPAVANYLKQMKNTAKQDQENLCLRVLKQLKQPKPAYHQLETVKLSASQQIKRDIVTHPMLKDAFNKMHMEIANFDSYTIVIPSIIQTAATKNYRNPYDIPRRDLIDEIARMRENFFHLPTSAISVFTKDSGHCLPISDMGNYQEYLKNKETPLRELEPTNVRQHMFGNPYKKDKNMVMVDEADLNDMAPMKPGPHLTSHMKKSLEQNTVSRLSRKRKAGPIRKDYVFKRSALDLGSTSSGSLSGEDVNMADLLSDDDSSSEYSNSSDTEDDSEGCLVMALDSTEEVMEAKMLGNSEDMLNSVQVFLAKEDPLEVQCVSSLEATRLHEGVSASSPSKTDSKVSSSDGAHQTPVSRTQPSLQISAPQSDEDSAAGADQLSVVRRPQSPDSPGSSSSNTPVEDTQKEQQRADEDSANSEKKPLVEQAALSSINSDVSTADSDVASSRKPHGQDQTTNAKKNSQQQQQQQSGETGTVETVKKTTVVDQNIASTEPTEPPLQSVRQPYVEQQQSLPRHEQQEGEQNRLLASTADTMEMPQRPEQNDHQSDQTSEQPNLVLATSESPAVSTIESCKDQVSQKDDDPASPVRTDETPVDLEKSEHCNDETPEPSVQELEQDEAKLARLLKQPEHSVVSISLIRDVGSDQPVQLDLQLNWQSQTEKSPNATEVKQTEPPIDAMEATKKSTEPNPELALEVQTPQQLISKESTLTPRQHHEQQLEPQHEPIQSDQPAEQKHPETQNDQQQHDAHPQKPTLRHQPVPQWSLASSTGLDDSNDLTDVLKISNILKTCHNGGDNDREKDTHTEDSPCDRPADHDGTKSRPETEAVMMNGISGPIMNGGDNTIQPTLNWDYNFALYSCVEDEQELEQIEEMNLKTRSVVFRDIRRPGRDYTQLIKHLELVQGSRSTQKNFIDMCMHEARRFRRHRMADCIQQWWEHHIGLSSGMKSSSLKLDGTSAYYSYDSNDMEDEQDNVLGSNNLYFVNDTGASVYGSEVFRSTTPPSAMYMNNSISMLYGTDFSHNNHHF